MPWLDHALVGPSVSYPVLPWFGVIAAGYALGPLFARPVAPATRRAGLLALGGAMLVAVLIPRGLSGQAGPEPTRSFEPGTTLSNQADAGRPEGSTSQQLLQPVGGEIKGGTDLNQMQSFSRL